MKPSPLAVAVGTLSVVFACANDAPTTPPPPPPPPPPPWIQPATMAGTWNYRGYYMYQAGCWPEGGGTVCRADSVLEAFTGTVVLSLPRDSIFNATSRNWIVPTHIDIHVQRWDYFGACDGQPLSCFTSQSPTLEFDETRDSILEIGQGVNQPAQLVLRDGRVQWAWQTTAVAPTRVYDSVGAAPPPVLPGVRDLHKP